MTGNEVHFNAILNMSKELLPCTVGFNMNFDAMNFKKKFELGIEITSFRKDRRDNAEIPSQTTRPTP